MDAVSALLILYGSATMEVLCGIFHLLGKISDKLIEIHNSPKDNRKE